MLSYLCISVFNLQQVGKRLVPVSSGQCVIFVNVNVCLFPSALRLPYFCIYLCSSFVYFSMFSYLCISVFNLRQVGKTLVPVSTCQGAAAALWSIAFNYYAGRFVVIVFVNLSMLSYLCIRLCYHICVNLYFQQWVGVLKHCYLGSVHLLCYLAILCFLPFVLIGSKWSHPIVLLHFYLIVRSFGFQFVTQKIELIWSTILIYLSCIDFQQGVTVDISNWLCYLQLLSCYIN